MNRSQTNPSDASTEPDAAPSDNAPALNSAAVNAQIEKLLQERMDAGIEEQIQRQVQAVLKNDVSEQQTTIVVERPNDEMINGPPNDGMTIDGVSAIAAVVIASFAVDRFATFGMFVLSLFPFVHKWLPDPKYLRQQALRFRTFPAPAAVSAGSEGTVSGVEDTVRLPEYVMAEEAQLADFKLHLGHRRYYIAYYLFAVAAATVLAKHGNMQLLNIVGFKDAKEYLEIPLTILILTAGADRIKALFNSAGIIGEPAQGPPLEITGSLNIEGDSDRRGEQSHGKTADIDLAT